MIDSPHTGAPKPVEGGLTEAVEWHREAFAQGIEARGLGFAMNDPGSNPYLPAHGFEPNHWAYRSFVAGWCDEDMVRATEQPSVEPPK